MIDGHVAQNGVGGRVAHDLMVPSAIVQAHGR